jgi:hypothetical protein
MARKPRSVYERIEDKRVQIKDAEEVLRVLNEELNILDQEKDELEMKQLLERMKANNLNITQAIDLLDRQNTKPTKIK